VKLYEAPYNDRYENSKCLDGKRDISRSTYTNLYQSNLICIINIYMNCFLNFLYKIFKFLYTFFKFFQVNSGKPKLTHIIWDRAS